MNVSAIFESTVLHIHSYSGWLFTAPSVGSTTYQIYENFQLPPVEALAALLL
jgi:hypothetical protein